MYLFSFTQKSANLPNAKGAGDDQKGAGSQESGVELMPGDWLSSDSGSLDPNLYGDKTIR